MAGTRSEMQRHAEEPTAALLFMLEHDRRMAAKEKELQKKKEEEEREMRKRSEEQAKNSSGDCWIGATSYSPEKARQLHIQEIFASPEMLAKERKKKKNKIKKEKKRKKKKAAEASVTEAGKPEGAELEQRALLDSQEKLANKKKAEDEEAEARIAEAYLAGVEAYLAEAQAYLTGAKKSVTEASKAAEDAAAKMPVFEDAEYFGADFESFWNTHFRRHCAYDEITTIPAMRYTHGSDCDVSTMDTLQIFSIKVASINEGLSWPLQVFGTVSARDVVDRKRNIIFHRERDNCQTITEQDPYITLTGPSRAVVVDVDPSYIEVVLKVKGATESEDKELSRLAAIYRLSTWISGLYPCELSTLELRLGLVPDSVEATVHVKVTGGSWPDGFKGVFSAANARNEVVKVKLLDIRDDGLPVDAADGMIRLSRRVVSVELRGMLKLYVSAYSAAGDEERCEASIVPAEAGVSSGVELKIGSCRMEATVAWSLFCDDY